VNLARGRVNHERGGRFEALHDYLQAAEKLGSSSGGMPTSRRRRGGAALCRGIEAGSAASRLPEAGNRRLIEGGQRLDGQSVHALQQVDQSEAGLPASSTLSRSNSTSSTASALAESAGPDRRQAARQRQQAAIKQFASSWLQRGPVPPRARTLRDFRRRTATRIVHRQRDGPQGGFAEKGEVLRSR